MGSSTKCLSTHRQRTVNDHALTCLEVDIIEEIFGLEIEHLDRNIAPQVLLKNPPNAFVQVQSYPKVVEESLISFLCDFVKEAIDSVREEMIFFVVLDNVSMMEGSSWALFEAIT